MSDIIAYSTAMLDALASLFMTEPFIWFFGIILMLVVFKLFKSLCKF